MQTSKIEKIESSKYNGVVYNLEVEEDNSYVTELLTVHNCSPSASKDVLFSREILDKQVAIQPIKTLAGFKIFKEFNAGHRIAGGGDVALGVGLDSSTTTFIDFDTIPAQVIGTYYNNEIKPDDFGDEMARQGRIFGECLLAPEKNNAGHATIGRLKQIYPMSRIHATRKKENGIHVPVLNEFGWDCVDPEAKVLNENLIWVKANTIKEGDVIVGSQEQSSKMPSGKDNARKLKYTKVLKVKSFKAKKLSVMLKDGTVTKVSDNHPFLVTKNSWSKAVWCRADELKEGYVVYKMDTWERNMSFEAGRLSGLLCGEGNIQYGAKTSTGYKSGLNLLIAQSVGIISDEIPVLWEKAGFTPNRKYIRHKSENRTHHKTMTYTGVGKAISVIKALGVLQPIRLIEVFKSKNLIESVSIRSLDKTEVQSVTHIGEGEVIGIETNEHTLFVDGILSHNTNSLTKSKMLNDLSSAIDDGLINLNDEDLIREARSYTRNDLMDRDIDPRLATRHYDLLISCCIAYQMKDYAVKSSHSKNEYDPFQEIWDTNNIKGHDTSFE